MMEEYIATFYSHFGAITFLNGYVRKGLKAVVMSIPRSLSSSCGIHLGEEAFPQKIGEMEQIVKVCENGFKPVSWARITDIGALL